MSKGIKLIFIVILAFLVIPVTANYNMVETIGNGEIDWETGIIRVVGYGVPPRGVYGAQAKLMARGAAKADAYRNAVEVLKGVRVNSQSYVQNYVIQSDEIRTSVDGFVQGAHIVGVNQQADGMVEVILELPLGGQAGLTAILSRSTKPTDYENHEIPEWVAPSILEQTSYTGVIIDGRNLGLKPALYPQIFDVNGYLLYSQLMVDMERPGFTTMVAYSRSMEMAKKIPRVGKNPLIIPAVSAVQATDAGATDLVLDSEASKAFQGVGREIIKNAAVVFIID